MARLRRQKKEITKNDRAVLDGLRYVLNHYPLHRRVVIAWRIIGGRW